jgi:hypothetical protein
MQSIITVTVGHRYLFLEMHVDGDVPFEAIVEEISPSGKWAKLRMSIIGGYVWKATADLHVEEELKSDANAS